MPSSRSPSFARGRTRFEAGGPARPRPSPLIELRRPRHFLLLVGVLALAGCATPPPAPEPAPPEPLVLDIGPPEPPPEPPAAELPPPLIILDPFPPEISAELLPLPPPAEDLWDRIRKGYALPDLDDAYVRKWEEWYASRPEYIARIVDRSRRYLYYIVVEVEERRMPLEIALLPMIESAFNPVALSSARAAGIWQFMPATGANYGLKQNFWFDSRRDVIAATDGALAYLQKLYGQFNDWQLALAAYNWGEGNVRRAIERNQRAGLPTDYASLKMPNETRNYLPKLQAVKNIVGDPAAFDLELGDIPDAPYFAVVRTARKMDVKRAAELAELTLEEFQYLNPHHNRPVIAGSDEFAILLPIDKAEIFAAKLDLTDQPLVSWQAYRLRPGETLAQLAGRLGMPEASLRAVNGIGVKARVPAGHTLLVPAERPSRAAAETLTTAVFTTVPKGRTSYHRVGRGETLTGIAARYSVTTAELKQWNNLAHDSVATGQQLRIGSDRAAGSARARAASGQNAKAGGTTRRAVSIGGGSSAANGSPKKPVAASKR
jgi:membrane-bound lytic murein transglycosylase D